jgi:hypothetical protein
LPRPRRKAILAAYSGEDFMLRISAPFAGVFFAASALAAGVDYNVTPLTQADVSFYMDIMRAAAQHNAHLTGDDKAAVDYVIALEKHPPPPMPSNRMPTQAEIAQMMHAGQMAARAAQLATYDGEIAKQRGVYERYSGIKGEVEAVYALSTMTGASCGGNDCGGTITAAMMARGRAEDKAILADKPLVAPHVAEIKTLKQQIGGFMFANTK